MRGTFVLIAGLAIAAIAPIGCGDSGGGSQFPDGDADGGGSSGSSGNPPPDLGGTDGSTGGDSGPGAIANITSARIDVLLLAQGANSLQQLRLRLLRGLRLNDAFFLDSELGGSLFQ